MTGFHRVFFDTAPFIFFLEKNPDYYENVKAFVAQICYDESDCITSTITIEEYSVVPYRDGETDLLEQFEDFIRDGNGGCCDR